MGQRVTKTQAATKWCAPSSTAASPASANVGASVGDRVKCIHEDCMLWQWYDPASVAAADRRGYCSFGYSHAAGPMRTLNDDGR